MKKTNYSISLFLLIPLMSFASPNVIIGEDELEKLKDLDPRSEIYQKSLPTGRLKLPGPLGIPDYCTVSLVSPRLVITAAHCLKKRDVTKLVVFFEYYTKASKSLNPYPVTAVKLVLEKEDIAILELQGTPGLKYGAYPIAKRSPVINEPLIIYEHPGLDEKSVSRKNCKLDDTDGVELLHTCDTENYSSGSPILNTNFEIVGVHQGAQDTNGVSLNYGRWVIGLKLP